MNGKAWLLILLLDSLGMSAGLTQAASEQARLGCEGGGTATNSDSACHSALGLKPLETNQCQQDLECWSERFEPLAQKLCTRGFDQAALWDARWWSLWDGEPLTHVRWRSRPQGVLEYYLDHGKTQLQCVFDPSMPGEVQVMYFPRDDEEAGKFRSLAPGEAVLSAGS